MTVEEFIAARLAYVTEDHPVQTALGGIAEIHFSAGLGTVHYCEVCDLSDRWPCATILAVASYWSHHPDYQWGERA